MKKKITKKSSKSSKKIFKLQNKNYKKKITLIGFELRLSVLNMPLKSARENEEKKTLRKKEMRQLENHLKNEEKNTKKNACQIQLIVVFFVFFSLAHNFSVFFFSNSALILIFNVF